MPYKLTNLTTTLFFIISIFICLFYFYLYKTYLIKRTYFLIFFRIVILLKNLIREILITEKNNHFPLFLLLFLVLLLSNILGILPYSLSITSHFSVTLSFAFIYFIAFNIIGLGLHKENFVLLFLPKGTPFLIIPFIILIELISYSTRLFSLAIRLFANIISIEPTESAKTHTEFLHKEGYEIPLRAFTQENIKFDG